MEKQLSKFLTLNPEDKIQVFGTKNQYEGLVAAICINDKCYVLAENLDSTRRNDIDKLIGDEFTAAVKGWCVLKKFQKEFGTMLEFKVGKEYTLQTTFEDGSYYCWLLEITPMGIG